MTTGPSFSYTVGEPMDANNKVDSNSEVLVDSIDGSRRIIDLDSVLSGTVILVDHVEYMKVLSGVWVRYTGSTISSEELASRIRMAQGGDLPVILIHVS